MRIAVIAANGRSGQAFVEAALNAGYKVNAGILGKSFLKPHPDLTILPCDATKLQDLKVLLNGQEAVVSLIGHIRGSAPNVQSVAIQNVIIAMKETNIKRLVSLTGTGVRFPNDNITFIDRILNFGINVIDSARIKDGRNHAEIMKKSGLDWTLIRVLKLQNTRPRAFQLKTNGPTKLFVAREEVAQAILEVLENNSYIHQAPIIGK